MKLNKQAHKETDRHVDRQVGRQTDRQTDRPKADMLNTGTEIAKVEI